MRAVVVPLGVLLPTGFGLKSNNQDVGNAPFLKCSRKGCIAEVVLQDERLTSREAESRLAIREKDWRARKKRLDAAAAAIILQEYLDGR